MLCDEARVHLMAPMELWQNSSTFVSVVVLCKQKLMILQDDLKNEDEHKNEEDLNIEDLKHEDNPKLRTIPKGKMTSNMKTTPRSKQ